ncbi:MAG: component of SufBCD complex, partial [Cypionkella sp.]|nr:component of SufBCD complex [Cypionkella sp.]
MALLPWNGARLKGICYVFGETGIAMLGLMLEAISLRSFSTLWYWIAVAVFWVRSLRGVMGISHGMVARARRGGAALAHLEA